MDYVLVALLTGLLSYLLHRRTVRLEREQAAEEKKWRALGTPLRFERLLLEENRILKQLVKAYQSWAILDSRRCDGWR